MSKIKINSEELEQIKREMCDDYCFYATVSHDQEALDLHCEDCPLNRLKEDK